MLPKLRHSKFNVLQKSILPNGDSEPMHELDPCGGNEEAFASIFQPDVPDEQKDNVILSFIIFSYN